LRPLQVGVIGCGSISTVAHIPLLTKIKGVRVLAIADPDPHRLDVAHRIAPGASRHQSIDDLLNESNVDALIIASPTALHAANAITAFQSSVHVYLEKPVAASMDDALAVVDAWHKSGRVGAIGHNFRFNPVFARLASMIRDGSIHNIRHFESEFIVPHPAESSWRRSAEGGGALLDLATHHIDLVRFLSNSEVTSVTGKIESRVTYEDHAVIDLVLASGCSARVTVAFGGAFIDRIAVDAESGRIEADRSQSHLLPFPSRLLHIAKKLRSPMHEPSFERSLNLFVDSARSGIDFHPNLDDGCASLEIALAARNSAASGLPISMGSCKLGQNE